MPIAMKRAVASSFLFLCLSSCVSLRDWPQWTDDVVALLRCEMTIEELEALVDMEIRPAIPTTYYRNTYATHAVYKNHASVKLHFENTKLKGFARWKPWGLMGVYISPKTNLCTGELTFLLSLRPGEGFFDAAVYLDGTKIEDPWNSFTVSAGQHELRIEREDHEPIVKHIQLDEDDLGDQRMYVNEGGVHRFGQVTNVPVRNARGLGEGRSGSHGDKEGPG